MRFLAAAFLASAVAIDNGLGLTPPLGWRSWNLFGARVNQQVIERQMDGMVSRKRMVDGKPTSLCDLGYCDVGLDDNWQKCGSYGQEKFTYHNNTSGRSVLNYNFFPDMKAMTTYAHQRGLTAGWYHNNCICKDHCNDLKCYKGDAELLIEFGFDAVKLDGCGAQLDLDLWARLFNESGKPIMIENCHWGGTVPNATWCPWNFFRTSGDVRASYESVVNNLQTTIQWATKGYSRPGCWAYPDMLEVGCAHGPGGAHDPGLTFNEARSHFGAWAIVSSPLTLSHDTLNDTISDEIWPIITNRETLAINQAWAGYSGGPFKQASTSVSLGSLMEKEDAHDGNSDGLVVVPVWQWFRKPLKPNGAETAVLLMNHDSKPNTFTLHFADIPEVKCTTCHVRNIWTRRDLGAFTGSWTAENVASHDSVMLVITPA